MTGRSQAVRLDEVFIRRNADGDVVLSARPADWSGFIAAAEMVYSRQIVSAWGKT